MKNVKTIVLFLMLGLLISSCGSEDAPISENFSNTFSFEINGVAYAYEDFMITNDEAANGPRVFVSQDDENLRFSFNFYLDLTPGPHTMNWNDGSSFFFARIPEGDFFTLDPSICRMNVLENDQVSKRLDLTFDAIGQQGFGNEEVSITNGVLRVNY